MKKIFLLFFVISSVSVFAEPGKRQDEPWPEGIEFQWYDGALVPFTQNCPETGVLIYEGQRFDWKDKVKPTGVRKPDGFLTITQYDYSTAVRDVTWRFSTIGNKSGNFRPLAYDKASIQEAQKYVNEHLMKGMVAQLPDVDDNGEVFQEYKKNDDYTRKIYETREERIEDIITDNAVFNEQFRKLRDETFTEVIPRNNNKLTGAETGMYRTSNVPKNFPKAFWGAIVVEGRTMKVIAANGNLEYGVQVAYYCTPDFKKDYPNARWAWKGEDKAVIGLFANKENKEIKEDIRSSSVLEFSRKAE
jgi:hypothetical protein